MFCRENDQAYIDMDNVFCQRIVRATKEVPYVDFGDRSSLDMYDGEPSTPDNATAESVTVVPSHLALQERSFSEEGMNKHSVPFTGTPISDTASIQLSTVPSPHSLSPVSLAAGPASVTLEVEEGEGETDPPRRGHSREEKIVYSEGEMDNSCMIYIDDDHSEAVLKV